MQARHLHLVIASSTPHTPQPVHSLPTEDQMHQQQRFNGQASDSLQHAGRQNIVQHLEADQKPFTAAHLAHSRKRRRLDYASGHRAPQVQHLCWLQLHLRACQRGLALLLQSPADMHTAALVPQTQ